VTRTSPDVRRVLDADVASLSIKDRLSAPLLRELVGTQVGITFVILGELIRAVTRQWGSSRRAGLDAWLATRPTPPTPTTPPNLG
jgi:hypothetical protein